MNTSRRAWIVGSTSFLATHVLTPTAKAHTQEVDVEIENAIDCSGSMFRATGGNFDLAISTLAEVLRHDNLFNTLTAGRHASARIGTFGWASSTMELTATRLITYKTGRTELYKLATELEDYLTPDIPNPLAYKPGNPRARAFNLYRGGQHRMLQAMLGGGTSIHVAMSQGLDRLLAPGRNGKKRSLNIITDDDGFINLPQEHQRLKYIAEAQGVRIVVIYFGAKDLDFGNIVTADGQVFKVHSLASVQKAWERKFQADVA